MIAEVLTWGVSPKTITTDTWYASQKNLKFFKDKGLEFLTGIAKNRSCSVDGKNFTQVQNLEIPEAGLIVSGLTQLSQSDKRKLAHKIAT